MIVVEDLIEQDAWRRRHLLGNCPFEVIPSAGAEIDQWMEAGAHHLRIREPVRGAVDFYFEGLPIRFRRLVLWSLHGYSSIREAILDAAKEYERLFAGEPLYCYMKRLPSGIENGQEVGSVILFEADWMPGKSVAVGFRGVGGIDGKVVEVQE